MMHNRHAQRVVKHAARMGEVQAVRDQRVAAQFRVRAYLLRGDTEEAGGAVRGECVECGVYGEVFSVAAAGVETEG